VTAFLEVRGLTVAYGGAVAVSKVSLSADVGRITGLIGPNGAGKTSTFNAISGLVRPAAGSVLIDGRDVTRTRPPARAQLGLGRTFQRVQVCESMTVHENIAVGIESRRAGGSAWRQVLSSRQERHEIAARAEAAITVCGLSPIANAYVGTLSTGQRRLVELARVIATDFRMLLLDEPSSGLDEAETAAFGAVLQRVVAERGCGVLLVEHDMSLVMGLCSYIHVLDFGQPLFAGTPAEVRDSDVVRAAYLGTDGESFHNSGAA
jgi:ABC-type branched-subunit amino acid transport system ATPase component